MLAHNGGVSPTLAGGTDGGGGGGEGVWDADPRLRHAPDKPARRDPDAVAPWAWAHVRAHTGGSICGVLQFDAAYSSGGFLNAGKNFSCNFSFSVCKLDHQTKNTPAGFRWGKNKAKGSAFCRQPIVRVCDPCPWAPKCSSNLVHDITQTQSIISFISHKKTTWRHQRHNWGPFGLLTHFPKEGAMMV